MAARSSVWKQAGTGLWEALLQSGGIDVLDAQTIELMHKYFGALDYGTRSLEDARTKADLHLYPNLEAGRSAFYDAESGRLRPRYSWYPRTLWQLRSNLSTISILGDSVLVHLDTLPGTPPAEERATSD